MSPFSEQEAGD